jgi:hypothetical protein
MLRFFRLHQPALHNATRNLLLICGATVAFLPTAGCQKALRVTDPQLRPIQETLDAQLPPGSSEQQVMAYLEARGYPIEASDKKGTIVTTIRHIDTQKVQPVTARVTFYFDATNKLNTVEIQRTMNKPIQ